MAEAKAEEKRSPRAQKRPTFKMTMDMPTVVYGIGDQIPDGKGGYYDAAEKESAGKWYTGRFQFEITSSMTGAQGSRMHESTLIVRVVDRPYKAEVPTDEVDEEGRRKTKMVERPSEILTGEQRDNFVDQLQRWGTDPEMIALLRNRLRRWNKESHGHEEQPMDNIGEAQAVQAARCPYQLPGDAKRTRTIRVPFHAVLEAVNKPGALIRLHGRSPIHIQGIDLVVVKAMTAEGEEFTAKVPRRFLVIERPKWRWEGGKVTGIEKPGMVILVEHEDPKVRLGMRLRAIRGWIEERVAPFLTSVTGCGIRPKKTEKPPKEEKPADAKADAAPAPAEETKPAEPDKPAATSPEMSAAETAPSTN